MGVVPNEWGWMGVGESAWELVREQFSIIHFIIVCHMHIYKESTFCDCLTVKEFLAQDRHNI